MKRKLTSFKGRVLSFAALGVALTLLTGNSSYGLEVNGKKQLKSPKVQLSFDSVDVGVVMEALSKSCGRNLVISPKASQVKVTINVDDPVSCRKAEELIARATGLIISDDGKNLVVETAKEAKEDSKTVVGVYKLKTASVSEVEKTLKSVKIAGKFSFDEKSNVVVFVGPKYEESKVSSLIRKLDENAKRKVIRITAKIIEIDTKKEKTLGGGLLLKFFKGNWGGGFNYAGQTVVPSAGASSVVTVENALALGYLSPSDALKFDLYLKALETEGVAKLISEPTILTEENEKGKIEQGVEIPYVTTSTAASGVTTSQVQWKTATLALTVEPRVVNGKIKLKISLKKDIPDYSVTTYTNGQPAINTKSINSVVYVSDGAEVVIGGIIERKKTLSKTGVPILEQIPLLGWLFKERDFIVENRKLIITLKAEVLKPDNGNANREIRKVTEEFYGRL